MLAGEEDLNARARIRNAALAAFAADGVEAASIRRVAADAGVSPGLVQHHFKTKQRLREAVDGYAIESIRDAFADLRSDDGSRDLVDMVGDRITEVVRTRKPAVLYIARMAAAGHAAGIQMFDELVALADELIEALAAAGLVEPHTDRRWASLHAVIIRLGTVLLEPALGGHLERPFRSAEELERWNRASTFLFRNGVFQSRHS